MRDWKVLNGQIHFDEFEQTEFAQGIKSKDERVERFAQLLILKAIGVSPALSKRLVLKGGNALDLFYYSDRSTKDIDFSNDSTFTEEWLREEFRKVLTPIGLSSDAILRVQKCKVMPREDGTRRNWRVGIGYALRTIHGHEFDQINKAPNRTSSRVIELDISENEYIGKREKTGLRNLHVASTEDIIAEKLRAILQQPLRNRHREQDVFDIATLVRNRDELSSFNYSEIRTFHEFKCKIRDVETGLDKFSEPEVKERSRRDYDELANTVRGEWIGFEDAWAMVMELVRKVFSA